MTVVSHRHLRVRRHKQAISSNQPGLETRLSLMHAPIPVVPLLVLLIILSPAALIRSKIEQSVAAKAPELLGPARSYSVDVTGGFIDFMRGRIKRVYIKGKDVRLENGIVVDSLVVNLSGVHFKRDQTITGIDRTTFTASLSERHLQDYLRKSRSDMSDSEVSLPDGRLVLRAKPRVMAIKTPVKIEGKLQIENGTRLNIILSNASAVGIRVPGFVRGRIQKSVNPVMDTKKMGMQGKLTKVEIKKGHIALSGTADVSKALVAKQR